MAANSKVNRIAELSLAAAVAGTLTLVPVAKAQTPSSSVETPSSVAPVVSTPDAATPSSSTPSSAASSTVKPDGETPKASSNVAPTTDWAAIFKGLAALIVPAEATGSGTSGVTFESNNQKYTALASNPTNGRLYAISAEGHLLRIHPQTGNAKDLGEIPTIAEKKITSAAFTENGTLVLIDGDSVYLKDLANDPVGPSNTPDNLIFEKKAIDTERALPALAWAPTDNADELVALATTKDGDATSWTLNVDGTKATISEADVDVRDTVNLSKVDAFAYAYRDGDATIFADETGHSVTLENGNIVAADSGHTTQDNYKAVAGLQAKPASEAPAAPAEPAPAASNKPSAAQVAPEVRKFKAVVKTAEGGLVSGATFTSPDGTVAGKTGDNGAADITLTLNEASRGKDFVQLTLAGAPDSWGNAVAVVERGAETVTFTLPAGENATATTTVNTPKPVAGSATTSDNLIPIEVFVRTADDKVVEGAEFRSEDGAVAGTTGADGRGTIYLDPKNANVNLIRLTLKEAPKGYTNTDVTIRRSDGRAELVLPRDPKATPSSTLSRPDQVLKAINEIRPVASSFLAPAAAIGAASAAGTRGTKSTKTTFAGTSVTASTTSRATGRSTSVTPSATVVTRAGKSTAVAKANTSTRATVSDNDTDERDGDLADTGTPMRAIIALGVLSMLIGGAYLALGRRRENA